MYKRQVIYRAPIFVDDRYWGLLSTVIDIDSLLHSALQDSRNHDYPFAVVDYPQDGALLWGEAGILDQAEMPVVTTTMGWRVMVQPVFSDSQLSLQLILRGLGYIVVLVAIFSMFTIMLNRRQLLHLSQHDALTGIANRRTFDERLEIAVARLGRNPRVRFAIGVLDLDGFKRINDVHGHAAGDAVLKEVARRLQSLVRETDLASRWGGDEFGALLEINHDSSRAQLRTRLMSIFDEPVEFRQTAMSISGSIGLAIAPDDGVTAEALFAAADKDMYQHKHLSKNRKTKVIKFA